MVGYSGLYFYFLKNAVRYEHKLHMVLFPDIVVWILGGQKDFIFSCHFITLLEHTDFKP